MDFKTYFPSFSEWQLEKLNSLFGLYFEWNDKINVISRKDINNLNVHHILHSLSICKFIQFANGSSILDLGTGGGFPGVPLAISFPECHFTLVDSRAKKLKVIDNICKQLQIENVTTKHIRAEELELKFDFVVSRAVAKAEVLLEWSAPLIRKRQINSYPNGLIALKGGDISEELKPLQKDNYLETIEIKNYFDLPYFDQKYLVYIQI